MDLNKLWAIGVPLICSVGTYYAFLRWRTGTGKASVLAGFLGWLLYLAVGLVSDLLAHALHPAAYQGIGDNPGQMAGLVITYMLSLFLCPIIWASLRWRMH